MKAKDATGPQESGGSEDKRRQQQEGTYWRVPYLDCRWRNAADNRAPLSYLNWARLISFGPPRLKWIGP